MQSKLFTESQSGLIHWWFMCCIIVINCKLIDCNPQADMRGVFLDTSNTFNKVWYEGLIFKLKSFGIDGDLLKLLINYLEYHTQRVVLNGQASSWKTFATQAGFTQGSVLGPILFLICKNDLPNGIESICKFLLMISHFPQMIKTKNALLLNLTII